MLRNFLKLQMYICLFAMVLSIVSCSSQSKEKEDAICFIDTAAVKDSIVSQPQRIGIKMHKSGGVYEIPCVVNGLQMNFIFDTGASNVCISLTEALFMYKNGYITDEDLGEKSYSQVADGSIVVNMQLNLRSIEIADIELKNVDAIVVASMEAPLLLGQSAIQKIGKIEMEGDSLFIMGIPSNVRSQTDKDYSEIINLSPAPTITWLDKVKTFFGYEGKINELLEASKNANENDMRELAEKYCKQAIQLNRSNWKAYGYYGHLEYMFGDDNGWHGRAISPFEHAIELNKKHETHYFLCGDSISYDGCRNKLAISYALTKAEGLFTSRDEARALSYLQNLIIEQPMNV